MMQTGYEEVLLQSTRGQQMEQVACRGRKRYISERIQECLRPLLRKRDGRLKLIAASPLTNK